MKTEDDATPPELRERLASDIRAAGSNLKNASEACLGYAASYLQQFVKYGKPAWLSERDREELESRLAIDLSYLKPPSKPLADVEIFASPLPRLMPRPGDPIEDAREAAVVETWRNISKEDQDVIIRFLNMTSPRRRGR